MKAGRRGTCVDLFAGCGGLSLGLHSAGFDVVLAVERSPLAAETYYHNFIARLGTDLSAWRDYCDRERTPLREQLERGLFVGGIEELAEHEATLREVIARRCPGGLDLLAGGPPCQGFSLAGRRQADDERNELPFRFLHLVDVLDPRMVLIENVPGFRRAFRRHAKPAVADLIAEELRRHGRGYVVQILLLNAMHYRVPQDRPRLFILGVRADIAERLEWKDGWRDMASRWAVRGDRPGRLLVPVPPTFPKSKATTVGDAIGDLFAYARASRGRRRVSNELKKLLAQLRVPMARHARRVVHPPANHVLRKHSDRVIRRFRLYQVMRDLGLNGDLLRIAQSSSPEDHLPLYIRFPAASPDGQLVVRSQEELVPLMRELATGKHSQRALSLDKQSPTVMTLPDDFVHPTEPRTLTVREMARLQSFPDSFEFRGKETTGGHRRRFEVPQYTQVGNAVPPLLAMAIGRHLLDLLERATAAEPCRAKRRSRSS